jgi:hypothetical protein
MLQLVTTISVMFSAAAALFAWIQNRQIEPIESIDRSRSLNQSSLIY